MNELPALTIDVRPLGRRPGEYLRVERVVPAPDGLGLPLVTVQPGSPMSVEVMLESVLEGIWVSGSVTYAVAAECSRCLDPLTWEGGTELEDLFAYEAEPGDEDPPPLVEDDLVNLEPVIRDSILLDLPMSPLCREDCPGLCATCGVRLADQPAHTHDDVDPRWSALTALMADQTRDDDAG